MTELTKEYITEEPGLKTEINSFFPNCVYAFTKNNEWHPLYFPTEPTPKPKMLYYSKKHVTWHQSCTELLTKRIIQIFELSEKYKLKHPLLFTIEQDNDSFIALIEYLDLFGYGESIDEAIADLKESIVELYDRLKYEKENLAPLLQRDFNYLNNTIEVIDVP